MKKVNFLFGILTLYMSALYSHNDFQLWQVSSLEKKSNPTYRISINTELRFKNNVRSFGYVHAEPAVLAQIHDNYFGGAICRILADANSLGVWSKQVEVGPLFYVSGDLGNYKTECRAQLYYRILDSGHNHSAIRLRPGITLFSDKHHSLYVQNEFFYNHNDFQAYDRNRFTLGWKWKPSYFHPHELSIYYLRQDDKASKDATTQGTNVLGVTISLIF